jgi:hypothetical protein
VNYVHWNPVKHGHVERPEQWEASSIHTFRARENWGAVGKRLDRFLAPRKLSGDDF